MFLLRLENFIMDSKSALLFGTGFMSKMLRKRSLASKKVREELQKKDDDIRRWADKKSDFFIKPDHAVLSATLPQVSEWAEQEHYTTAAKRKFMGSADHILCAHALAHSYTVVTHEVPDPNSKRSIKIPDVCDAFRIGCISPYDMLRREKARFVLEKK